MIHFCELSYPLNNSTLTYTYAEPPRFEALFHSALLIILSQCSMAIPSALPPSIPPPPCTTTVNGTTSSTTSQTSTVSTMGGSLSTPNSQNLNGSMASSESTCLWSPPIPKTNLQESHSSLSGPALPKSNPWSLSYFYQSTVSFWASVRILSLLWQSDPLKRCGFVGTKLLEPYSRVYHLYLQNCWPSIP